MKNIAFVIAFAKQCITHIFSEITLNTHASEREEMIVVSVYDDLIHFGKNMAHTNTQMHRNKGSHNNKHKN